MLERTKCKMRNDMKWRSLSFFMVVSLTVGSLFAGSERIAGFGGADTSSANTFWNVSGYDGGNVWREVSASIVVLDTRSRTSTASSGVQISTDTPGMVVVFR